MATARPTLLQYLAYSYGRRLPDSIRSWVSHDLPVREPSVGTYPRRDTPTSVLAPLWLLPASLYVHLEMTAPIYIWALLMSLTLTRYGADTGWPSTACRLNLVDANRRKKDAHIHEDYIRRYGQRPETAKWQSNSSPF